MKKSATYYHKSLVWLVIVICFLLLPGCVSHEATPELPNDGIRSMANTDHILFREKGTTDLMFQSAKGDIIRVKKLLKEGADINEANINGFTALMFAAEFGNLSISRLLIDHGANIHKKTTFNHTALFLASSQVLPRARPYPKNFVFSGSPYVGENDHIGVIDYLISINAPIFEGLAYVLDTEYTANAFYNIATSYESQGHYTLAQQNYEVSMKNFVIAAKNNIEMSTNWKELRDKANKLVSEAGEWNSFATLGGLAETMLPVLDAANQRYQRRFQNRQMADAAAIRDAKKDKLDIRQTLNRRHQYQKTLEETPNLTPAVSPPNTAKVSKGDSSESSQKMNAAIESGFDIYQVKAKQYYEQATDVGIILECYKNEIADESFASCLEWPKKEFVYHGKEAGRQVLKIYGRSE